MNITVHTYIHYEPCVLLEASSKGLHLLQWQRHLIQVTSITAECLNCPLAFPCVLLLTYAKHEAAIMHMGTRSQQHVDIYPSSNHSQNSYCMKIVWHWANSWLLYRGLFLYASIWSFFFLVGYHAMSHFTLGEKYIKWIGKQNKKLSGLPTLLSRYDTNLLFSII